MVYIDIMLRKVSNFQYGFLGLIFVLSFFIVEKTQAKEVSPLALSQNFEKSLIFKVKDKEFTIAPTEWHKWVSFSDGLKVNRNYSSEIESPAWCKNNIFCHWLSLSVFDSHIERTFGITVVGEKLQQFLADLSRQVNYDPIDARFQVENGIVSTFSLSSNGLTLNQDKSFEIIKAFLEKGDFNEKIDLSFQENPPLIKTNDTGNLGIASLIAEGQSNFAGSPKNRIFNIKVATSRFNGLLIAPQEEFSFVKALGPVDAEHGYLPELVIKQDKTEPEFGGGICQVSTTCFRAAINSGLKITARKNHAYPVSYYSPQGFDSTVYIPRPDLRFVNNTPNYILIQTKIEGTILTFQFYGTSDGRKVNVIGPKVLERNPDGSMKTTLTQEVYDKNEKLMFSDVFNSNYASPDKYPHPGSVLTQKPANWSDKEWKKYQKEHANN